MKVFHLNILDDEQARKELNDPKTGGWSSQPRFTRYADITMSADHQQAIYAWEHGEYTFVADVEGVLEQAFSLTQNHTHDWQLNDLVTATPGPKRSTSVGDIVVKDGQVYIVASFGFEPLPLGFFEGDFDSYVCPGDTLSVDVDGYTITARIEHDQDTSIDDDDVHNLDCGGREDDAVRSQIKAARKAWLNDEWFYGGVVLSVEKAGIMLDEHAASLWGIEMNYPEGDNKYLAEVANELLSEALEAGRNAVYKLTRV